MADMQQSARSTDQNLQTQIQGLRDQMSINRADIDHLLASSQLDHALLDVLREQGELQVTMNDNLRNALKSSRRIGAAVGIVMSQRLLTEEAAFEHLRTLSQNSNVKLRDLADRIVETGVVPSAQLGGH